MNKEDLETLELELDQLHLLLTAIAKRIRVRINVKDALDALVLSKFLVSICKPDLSTMYVLANGLKVIVEDILDDIRNEKTS